jgi:ubiquinone biosynthesis protein
LIRTSQILRLLHINRILVRHGLDEIILATHLFRPVRFLLYLLPWQWLRRAQAPRALRIRRALEDLGPVFVKFGQMLSTRPDLLPDDIAQELALLQDGVAPFPGAIACTIIEQAYGKKISELFQNFDATPLASASIAQVHTAQLHDGRQIIVKVVRPGIEKIIARDVSLLYTLADLAERYWSEGPRLRPREIVAEYEKTIFDELDLLREAANASQLRRNFLHSPLLYVPEIDWPLARRNVLVMERIYGIPISDLSALRAQGIDLKALAERGVQIFFTQVFEHSFFHADMHPGNIFVSPQGRYIAVDFGIMGSLSERDQRYLVENFLAFFNRDYRRVAQLHVDAGWVPAETRVDEFEAAMRTVCEPIFERPLKDISFGQLLLRLFQTARRFNMEVQPQLALLQKTLLNIEGLGRQLYPDLDLWQTFKPFLEQWMHQRAGISALATSLKENVPLWAERLPEIPLMLHEVLKQAQEGKLQIEWKSAELERIRQDIKRTSQSAFSAILGSSLILSAAVIKGLDGYAPLMAGNAPLLAWLLGGAGLLILLSTWPGGRN